ncbi:hypothetical protein ACRQ5Q_24275 [Bradyrhizobium sp. PMVTL-01]|uniref:hypothetical protein n=1 Tax=Bradyrhizobium sp. PMVTL-01 TaxID=3434999 RepID=UPI003F72D773
MSDLAAMFTPNPMLAGRQPAASFNTTLDPGTEQFFRQWVAKNNVPFSPDATAPQDYDMRGFYQALMQQNPKAQSAVDPNDGRLHFPDFWKTPVHETFSNESQWAPGNAPAWTADDKLVAPSGRVVFDDRQQPPNLNGLPGQQPKVAALADLFRAR